ncbi:endo-1,4-beta-xylanase [Aureimonas jatrophae]|uniref:Beta-xylanase n=1 Tax=Aureimonas jatrophae TaxID=1166073 RepID=A0A1H0L488_9HYPH|nr:endo-1,4-beta-xylanase [Aureimonas jatrophae]MBB3952396.1 endo-1,4-beta-xylanase [Aureimonas jatrophae]SDO62823.1 endo-1,4-beta-xylanase [Aureimonas jatrophae]
MMPQTRSAHRSHRSSSSRTDLTRRSLLAGGAATLGASALPPGARAAAPVPFGAAIQFNLFESDPDYRQSFLDRCDLILPMNELKFPMLRPTRDSFEFGPADQLVDWARANGRTSRGHTFVWHDGNPDWLERISDPVEAEMVLREHIQRTAGHFRGRLQSWDVVNEVIAHEPRESGGPLRDTWWRRTLGPRHIPIAFAEAARADPDARLVLNDYDLEFRGARYDARRRVALDLVRQLQDGGLRIDAVGIQGHLYSHFEIDPEAMARFGRDLKALGVGLLATEIDVIDFQVPGGPEEIDRAAETVVGDFLDGLFAGQRPEAVITWGLTDRYSWVGDTMPRTDGTPVRPLPLDAAYRPKRWYDLLRQRLSQA